MVLYYGWSLVFVFTNPSTHRDFQASFIFLRIFFLLSFPIRMRIVCGLEQTSTRTHTHTANKQITFVVARRAKHQPALSLIVRLLIIFSTARSHHAMRNGVRVCVCVCLPLCTCILLSVWPHTMQLDVPYIGMRFAYNLRILRREWNAWCSLCYGS